MLKRQKIASTTQYSSKVQRLIVGQWPEICPVKV